MSIVGLAAAGALALSGCATTDDSGTTVDTPSAPASTPASDAGADKVILVTSFGTSFNDSRDITIGAIENAIQEANPDYEVRRAFTSQIIIDKLAERDGLVIDNVGEAMDRLVADGVKDLIIQPTTVMAGYEYTDLVTEAETYRDQFDSFAIGSPLLTTDADYEAVAAALTAASADRDDATAAVFMGHGTSAPSNGAYTKLNGLLVDQGCQNCFIGTVEAAPSLEDVIQSAKDAQVTKVVMRPLMVVAGDHANNDMAGDEPDSWKSQFTAAGFEVTTVIEGLGQIPEIQQLYVAHTADTIALAADPNAVPESSESAPESGTSAEPIAAGEITDGTYPITATSTKSMFKIVDAQLTVEEETMTVTMTLSGSGYGRLSLGSAAQAAKAVDGFIEFTSDDQDRHVYTVPISRLNQPMAIAAESMKNPGTWYDQTLVFSSEQIPADAITAE